MWKFAQFLRAAVMQRIDGGIRFATPAQAVAFLLAEEAYGLPGFDDAFLAVSNAAQQHLLRFPDEVRIAALVEGMDGSDSDVRCACAALLLSARHATVRDAMRRHLHDPDSRVARHARTYLEAC